MKKKKVILATILGVSALAVGVGVATGISIANSNSTVEIIDSFDADEATNACDDIFDGNTEAFRVTRSVAKSSQEETSTLVTPVIGRQFVVEDGYLYIRYYAAITSLETKAVWTKNLYTSDGTLSKSYGTTTSEYAYTALQYTEDNETKTFNAEDVEAEDGTKPYKYFVTYTIKGIPVSTHSEYYFDAYVTLSNDTNTIISKTGTVKTDSSATMSSYELDLVDTYNTGNTGTSSAGNGEYATQKAKTIYTTSDTALDTSNLLYLLNDELTTSVTVSGFTAGQEGKQTITVTTTRAAASYDIYVVSGETEQDADGNYLITVDQSYTGTIGEVVSGKGNMFTTISQALEFIQDTGIIASTESKILNIGAGYYKEKLEINTPNIKIVGASGAAHGTYSGDENYNETDYASSTIIEYDSLYDVADASGYKHTTDSTATVSVRDDATNVTFENVTISNAYNCKAYFDDTLGANYSEHRALALLVQADQFTMKNCSLLGYQDTLELFTGRQYFNSCYISGTTDYIFGTNSTTLFDNCTIHTIYNGSTSAGGYITAFKGCNYGSSDAINYGAIFYGCTLEGDTNTSNVSLGRPWGSYANVAYIECEMTSCISTTEYTASSTSGKRYVDMNAKPTDANVKFVEYGNTGDGAITETQTGMTYIDATAAANYYDYKTIFGYKNGYQNIWNYSTNEIVDSNIYYYFDGSSSLTGTSYTYEGGTVQGSTATFGDITIDATTGKLSNNGNSAQFNAGTILSFDVEAGTCVTITSFPGYYFYSVSGSVDTEVKIANANSVTYYFASAQTVYVTSIGSGYIKSIIINPDLEEPEKSLTSLVASGQVTVAETGDTIDTSKLTVHGIYSAGYKLSLDLSELDITVTDPDGNAFDLSDTLSTAGTYTVKVALTADDSIYTTYSVVVTSAVEYISTNTSITFGSAGNYSSNTKVDFTKSTISDNGTSNSMVSGTITFDVQAGAMIYIIGYSNYTSYTIQAGTQTISDTVTSTTNIYSVTDDSTVTIICGSNNYFYSIHIVYPVSTTETLVLASSNTDLANELISNTLQKEILVFGSYIIDATSGKLYLNGDNAQFNSGTTITFAVKAGATVTVTGYPGLYAYSINDNSATDQVTSMTFAEDTIVVVKATDNKYIKTISITY